MIYRQIISAPLESGLFIGFELLLDESNYRFPIVRVSM